MDAPVETTVERRSFLHPTWRVSAAGHIWRILEHFYAQGHVGLDRDTLAHIRTLAPPPDVERDPLPAVLVTIQVISTTRGAREAMELWSAREGTLVLASNPRWRSTPPPV